ncbi:ATP-binding cassette domain-containing protein, partial [Escherichia coli]|nr:ATP-binding cassette domain-containing protein [Escherichia coli]
AIMLQEEDFLKLSGTPLRRRRRLLQMVFQDSSAAFNPRTTIKRALETPLRIHNLRPPNGRHDRVMELLQQVGLDPSLSTRSIHEISGGQRQRVAIARALACEPDVIVLDEALSGVDASRRIELVRLLQSLQRSTGVAYLFISHDLPLVRAVSHRVAIIDCGEIVECGRASDIIENPQSPTARALIAAAPRLEPFR